jgi:hypothetical protein
MRLMIALVFALPVAAHADSVPGYLLASQVAEITASADACGYALDADAVSAFVRDAVDPADLSFAPAFRMSERIVAQSIEGYDLIALAAHCAAVSASASALGLVARD